MESATMEAPAVSMSKYVANRFGKFDCPFCAMKGANGLPTSASLAQHARHNHGRNNKLTPEQKRELVDANRDPQRPTMPRDLGEETGFKNPLRREIVVPPAEANGQHQTPPAQVPVTPARKPSRMEAAVQIMQLDAIRGMTKRELASVFEAVANLAGDEEAQGTEAQAQ